MGEKSAEPPLASVYELSARPNTGEGQGPGAGAWDAATGTALVERPNKHLASMGHWAPGAAQPAAERTLALFPEEALLLVEQGLLLLLQSDAGGVLSVAETQALALGQAELCPLYFEVFAHVRELGLAALRLELLHGGADHRAGVRCGGGDDCAFRGRPVLALWGAERAGKKGWRQTRPDTILATARACDTLPTAGEWAALEAIAARFGSTVQIAVVDGTGSPVIFDCSRGPAPRGDKASSHAGVHGGEPQAAGVGGAEDIEVDVETVMAQITVQGDKVRQLKKMAATDEALQRSLVLEIEELKRLKALLPHSTSAEPNRKRRKHSNSEAQT